MYFSTAVGGLTSSSSVLFKESLGTGGMEGFDVTGCVGCFMFVTVDVDVTGCVGCFWFVTLDVDVTGGVGCCWFVAVDVNRGGGVGCCCEFEIIRGVEVVNESLAKLNLVLVGMI